MSGPMRWVLFFAVIVFAGAGVTAARALARSEAEITVIDRRNYHLFQPLLYQVATAGLAPSEVAWPIRSILRRQRNQITALRIEREGRGAEPHQDLVGRAARAIRAQKYAKHRCPITRR